MTRTEVFALLGPERYKVLREPEFEFSERLAEAHPDRYPGERYWAKWADPADERRWVAVYFAGGIVRHTLKKGR